MLWLIPAVVACFAAALVLWNRGLQVPAALALGAGFALLFVLGRGLESDRDAAWQDAAARLRGTFRSGPGCAGLERFGAAPWKEWASDGELQCPRAIEGEVEGVPYALVQVRYSVRERRGEEHPDSWYEVTVAVVARPGAAAAGPLSPVRTREGYAAVGNGRALFLWKKGSPGVGASLAAGDLPALLEEARSTDSAPS